MSGTLGKNSGLSKERLITSTINGLSMSHEQMEKLLADAPKNIADDIRHEIEYFNNVHPTILYWREHGVWEAVVAYFNNHSTDAEQAEAA